MPRAKRRSFLASLGTGAALSVAGCIGGSESEGVTLRFNEFGHENHFLATGIALPYQEKVEERSDITFDMYLDSQLGNPTNSIELVSSGTADIATVLTPYESDLVPISALPTIPGSFNDSMEAASQYYDLVMDHLTEEEFAQHGVVPLFTGISSPYQLATVDPKVTSDDDWDGLTVRTSSGYHAAAIEAMGANPAQLSGPEQYQALERGTVDGTAVGLPNVVSQNLDDHINYITRNLNLGGFPVVYVIREESLEELSESQRDVMMTAGEEITNESMETFLDEEQSTIDDLRSQGIDVYDIPTDTRDEWQDTLYDAAIGVWEDSVDHENAEEYKNMLGA